MKLYTFRQYLPLEGGPFGPLGPHDFELWNRHLDFLYAHFTPSDISDERPTNSLHLAIDYTFELSKEDLLVIKLHNTNLYNYLRVSRGSKNTEISK